ncbi:hypothetical protein [Helicobacter bizzozeronii]|uniref:Uncharacterized protein n=1 Tax=Helicobacter bizzozeronii (strain CIII-1) TaxID=1002804 RepID=F8KUF8_HELBC|nr:hypothetical protein [Helicobacter bizzozeronii]CCB80893.1 hypothetical protein HBZC1_p0130 [Helicobacter bizzozeronii CIII-1]
MAKDYSKMSRRALEDLESRLHNEIIRLRDKYKDAKDKHEKDLKSLANKTERDIKAFTDKLNKELKDFENKGSKELEGIKKQGEQKVAEKQKVSSALNNLIYAKKQAPQQQEAKETKKIEATPAKQEPKETKATQESKKPQDVKTTPTQNQIDQAGVFPNKKPD